jgi:hypothetical protein
MTNEKDLEAKVVTNEEHLEEQVDTLEGELRCLREGACALTGVLREYTNDLHFFGKSDKLPDVLDMLWALEGNLGLIDEKRGS